MTVVLLFIQTFRFYYTSYATHTDIFIFYDITFQVARLDSQVIRFKTAAETAERSEEELKTERRKMQREVMYHIMDAMFLKISVRYDIVEPLEITSFFNFIF